MGSRSCSRLRPMLRIPRRAELGPGGSSSDETFGFSRVALGTQNGVGEGEICWRRRRTGQHSMSIVELARRASRGASTRCLRNRCGSSLTSGEAKPRACSVCFAASLFAPPHAHFSATQCMIGVHFVPNRRVRGPRCATSRQNAEPGQPVLNLASIAPSTVNLLTPSAEDCRDHEPTHRGLLCAPVVCGVSPLIFDFLVS